MGAGSEDALANWEGRCWSLGEKWESWFGGRKGLASGGAKGRGSAPGWWQRTEVCWERGCWLSILSGREAAWRSNINFLYQCSPILQMRSLRQRERGYCWGEFFDFWPQAHSSVGYESLVHLSLSPGADFGPATEDVFSVYTVPSVVTAHWCGKASFSTKFTSCWATQAPSAAPSVPPSQNQPASTLCSALCCQSNKPFLGLGCQ